MTQKSSEAPEVLKPSGPAGELAREDFTPERLAQYTRAASQFGGMGFLSDEQREQSRLQTLAGHAPASELWVFAYGSLMWNPAIRLRESLPARIDGYHRSFCMRLMFGRAMPDNQGLMLSLVPGGSCFGMAHCIAAEDLESETKILWMREMLSGAYIPSWVELDLGAKKVRGITFVINQEHPRYLPGLSADEKAERIAQAEGHLGSNRDYLFRTAASLDSAGIGDAYVTDLCSRVRSILQSQQHGETR